MSDKKTLLITRRMPQPVAERAARSYHVRDNAADTLYDSAQLVKLADGAEGLLICSNNRLDADTIAALPASVQIVACYTAGFEHVDIEAAAARGLVVTNSPDAVTTPTAEIAMLLMLGAARRGAESDRLVRSGDWSGWHTEFMIGQGLSGKRLGILGMGRIGRAVATRARGFGMEIHYHNRSRLGAAEEAGATYHETAEDLLAVSDFLSLHCPSTDETRNFLDARRIALLPEGTVVINTARGDVVDDDALIDALRTGRVAAAGLDVFRGEPTLHPGYAGLPNTFLLPHIGSSTSEGRNGMGFQALDNLDAFFAGSPPPNRVA